MESSTIQPLVRLKTDFDRRFISSPKSTAHQLIAPLVGSSQYEAVSDDALKDEDNAGWVMELDPSVRAEWIERIRWIRMIDRLAEYELLYPGKSEFQQFLTGWQHLSETGEVESNTTYGEMFEKMRDRWFGIGGTWLEPTTITAWSRYVAAISRYHTRDLIIETLEQYEQMLADLAGSFFQVLPFLSDHHRPAVCHFGMLDQFYNHLRDLQEDARQGFCYLPLEVLQQFGVTREEILQHTAPNNPNYRRMMMFWLNEYLPKLRRKARQLATADDLPSSWQILRDWSIYRYRRIDTVFRECQFNYNVFPHIYWQKARAEVALLLDEVQQRCKGQSADASTIAVYGRLRGWTNLILFPSLPSPSVIPSAM